MNVTYSLQFTEYNAVKQKCKSTIKQRFGIAIKQRRSEFGISQEELAFRSELHRTYVSDIERGSRNPSLINIEKLAKALKKQI